MSIAAPVWASQQAKASLVVNGQDTGVPLWTARSKRERRQGLRGTDTLAGALWITRCAAVHCIGMRYPIDVVHVTRRGRVLCVRLMRPGSIGLPRLGAYAVLELPAGWATRLGISTGAAVALGPPRQQERGRQMEPQPGPGTSHDTCETLCRCCSP